MIGRVVTYQVECKKDGLRQTQDGVWKLTITVHPNDMPIEILKAPMGRQYIAVFAEYDGGEPEQPKERREWGDMPRSQQAGMLCQDESFQAWVGGTAGSTAETVRSLCKVDSRSELDNNEAAAEAWDDMVADYRSSMGLRI